MKSSNAHIPFNRPYVTSKEQHYITEAISNGMLAGDGIFTKRCHLWLEENTRSNKALLTHSCTAALEMAALLLDIKAGDEIIMPSFTFVSTANAVVLRGGIPVFVDIREDTLNLNENLIEPAITSKTRAIFVVHYAGVACEMDTIMRIAKHYNLYVVEDAAQGMMSRYKGKVLGSIGDLGAYSFHETKNIISGEGGALLVNDPRLGLRAEIIREKGTNRSSFFRGEVDKYTWQDLGSSFLPGELVAAFLWAQLQNVEEITRERLALWQRYHELFEAIAAKGSLRRPIVPEDCTHNGHMYYVLLASELDRKVALEKLKKLGVNAAFHYVPLHSSPGGLRYGRMHGSLEVTNTQAARLLRLPMWVGLSVAQQTQVVEILSSNK